VRAYRDSQFRPRVLQAFNYKCCVCNCDLKLVDAAHIVPVSHPTSNDEVTNGLALCRLHHGAYDNALLGIQSGYQIVINPEATRRLHEIKLDTGLDAFKAALPNKIRVATVKEARPDADKLKLGLQVRGWPTDLIS
jgi:putative restriction endonuclease